MMGQERHRQDLGPGGRVGIRIMQAARTAQLAPEHQELVLASTVVARCFPASESNPPVNQSASLLLLPATQLSDSQLP